MSGEIYESQSFLYVCIYYVGTYMCFEIVALNGLTLKKLSTLSNHGDPGICLSLGSPASGLQLSAISMWVLEIEFKSSCLVWQPLHQLSYHQSQANRA